MQRRAMSNIVEIKINEEHIFNVVDDCEISITKDSTVVEFSTNFLHSNIEDIQGFILDFSVDVGSWDDFFIEIDGFVSNIKEDQWYLLDKSEKEKALTKNLESFTLFDGDLFLKSLEIKNGKVFFRFEK